jgi:hypothetical protein
MGKVGLSHKQNLGSIEAKYGDSYTAVFYIRLQLKAVHGLQNWPFADKTNVCGNIMLIGLYKH